MVGEESCSVTANCAFRIFIASSAGINQIRDLQGKLCSAVLRQIPVVGQFVLSSGIRMIFTNLIVARVIGVSTVGGTCCTVDLW